MAGKKLKRMLSFSSVILTAALLLTQSTFAFDVEENKQQQENLQKQAQQYEKDLEKTRNDIAQKQQYATALQGKISTLSKQITLTNETITELNKSIKEKQTQIDKKLAEIDDKMTELRGRIRTIYMAGDTSSLEIILGAKDFSDFIDKAEYIQSISAYDNKLIEELKSEMSKISEEQQTLKEQKSTVEKEKKSLESKKSEINKLSEENSQLIAELQGVESATLDSLGENEESQKELEAELKAYYEQQKKEAEKRAAEEAARKAQEQTNKNNSSSGDTTTDKSNNSSSNSNNNNSNTAPTGGGSYVWPCPGYYYLSSTYDENRGASNHGALDIAGAGIYGAQVVAARSGTVVSSYSGCTHDYGKSTSCGCGGGYGNYVVIEHSDGKTSLYGHLSQVHVSYGDYVTAGQLIGNVGSTGYSSGPHLHFETKYSTIWDHSQRYNPLDEYPGLF